VIRHKFNLNIKLILESHRPDTSKHPVDFLSIDDIANISP